VTPPPQVQIPTTPNQEEEEEIDLELLIREGGGRLNDFLFELAQKIQMPIQFKDLAQLPADVRKKWIEACLEELKALWKHGVYELVDLPKGCRAIKNCWVFNEKSDGRLWARLVAKGFSQVLKRISST
jgi:hypothetical protein